MPYTRLGQLHEQAGRLALKTSDAYSSYKYRDWSSLALFLLKRGYTFEQAEEILRSKITRWAADRSTHAYATVTDLKRYMDTHANVVIALFEGK